MLRKIREFIEDKINDQTINTPQYAKRKSLITPDREGEHLGRRWKLWKWEEEQKGYERISPGELEIEVRFPHFWNPRKNIFYVNEVYLPFLRFLRYAENGVETATF